MDGVAYRTGPKGWMDKAVFPQYFAERKVFKPLPNQRKRILFVDNCGGHSTTPELKEALRNSKTELHFFPPNATDLGEPADSFVIQKLKDAWRLRWDKYKMEVVAKQGFTEGSGKIPNPGKSFFLKLAVASVRDFKNLRDSEGLGYARKAMIRCGMSLNVNGLWEESQLFPKLHNIISRDRAHLNGNPVTSIQ